VLDVVGATWWTRCSGAKPSGVPHKRSALSTQMGCLRMACFSRAKSMLFGQLRRNLDPRLRPQFLCDWCRGQSRRHRGRYRAIGLVRQRVALSHKTR